MGAHGSIIVGLRESDELRKGRISRGIIKRRAEIVDADDGIGLALRLPFGKEGVTRVLP